MLCMWLKAVPFRTRSRLLFGYIVPLAAVYHAVGSYIQLLDAVSCCQQLCIMSLAAAYRCAVGFCCCFSSSALCQWRLCYIVGGYVISLVALHRVTDSFVMLLVSALCHITGGCAASCHWRLCCVGSRSRLLAAVRFYWRLCIMSLDAASYHVIGCRHVCGSSASCQWWLRHVVVRHRNCWKLNGIRKSVEKQVHGGNTLMR